MQTPDPTVFWQVSLSNGETFQEGKGDYKVIEGELSPWQRLKRYIGDDTTITSLSLFTEDGRSFVLPSGGKNPKFHAFTEAENPVSYNFFRKLGGDVSIGGEVHVDELYNVIEAEYENGSRLQIWVDNETHGVKTLLV